MVNKELDEINIPFIWYATYFNMYKNIDKIKKKNPEIIETIKKSTYYKKLADNDQSLSICMTLMICLEYVFT